MASVLTMKKYPPPLQSGPAVPPTRLGRLREALWHQLLLLESTWGFAMLEPWEGMMLYAILLLLTGLFWYTVTAYLPTKAQTILSRTHFYLYGESPLSNTFDL